VIVFDPDTRPLGRVSGSKTITRHDVTADHWRNTKCGLPTLRSVLIILTDRGRELVDEVVASHVANEVRLLESLSPREQEQLAGLLRKLLLGLGDAGQDASPVSIGNCSRGQDHGHGLRRDFPGSAR
jgi:hypothetical protein